MIAKGLKDGDTNQLIHILNFTIFKIFLFISTKKTKITRRKGYNVNSNNVTLLINIFSNYVGQRVLQARFVFSSPKCMHKSPFACKI